MDKEEITNVIKATLAQCSGMRFKEVAINIVKTLEELGIDLEVPK